MLRPPNVPFSPWGPESLSAAGQGLWSVPPRCGLHSPQGLPWGQEWILVLFSE